MNYGLFVHTLAAIAMPGDLAHPSRRRPPLFKRIARQCGFYTAWLRFALQR